MSDKRHLTESEKLLESRGYKIVTTIEECAKKGVRWRGGFDRKWTFAPLNIPHDEDKVGHLNLPKNIHHEQEFRSFGIKLWKPAP